MIMMVARYSGAEKGGTYAIVTDNAHAVADGTAVEADEDGVCRC